MRIWLSGSSETGYPDHLIAGTQQENVQDRYDRRRDFHRRGSSHGNAKFTETQVIEIRRRVAQGEKKKRLAREYGVSSFGIEWALKGWAHVKDPATFGAALSQQR